MSRNDDRTEQFARPHAGKDAAAIQRHDKVGSVPEHRCTVGRHPATRKRSGYTDREEAAMQRAIVGSRLYMRIYGHGRQPYEIDLSHYEQSQQPEPCKKKK